MVNILLEGYDISSCYLYEMLRKYIKPHHKVAVIALSFRDSRVKNLYDWNMLYSPEYGKYAPGIAAEFSCYGIYTENISYINYFADTVDEARGKIEAADILYFLGGVPDQMMRRIEEMQLTDTLLKFDGIVMGYSAGAVIQLAEYHLSPDDDYPEFVYFHGLPYLNGFYHEVHYCGSPEQDAAIQRVLRERKKPVYATKEGAGAILVEDGQITLLGEVLVFEP